MQIAREGLVKVEFMLALMSAAAMNVNPERIRKRKAIEVRGRSGS